MTRRSSFGDKLARELRRLVVTLVFVVAALWLGFFVLPDVLTAFSWTPLTCRRPRRPSPLLQLEPDHPHGQVGVGLAVQRAPVVEERLHAREPLSACPGVVYAPEDLKAHVGHADARHTSLRTYRLHRVGTADLVAAHGCLRVALDQATCLGLLADANLIDELGTKDHATPVSSSLTFTIPTA